jgi:hypothetical protein
MKLKSRKQRVDAVADKLLGGLYIGQRVKTIGGAHGVIVGDIRESPFADWVVRLDYTRAEARCLTCDLRPA